MSAWLEEMIKAADAATKGGTGDGTSIGNAADNQQGAQADAGSVNGIANGIKGIVDAAGKADGEDGDALKDVVAASDEANKDAGKLFKTQAGAGDVAAVAKAATAVSAVSGKQILKAIVDAAGGGDQEGKKAEEAKNPIAAAIGKAGDDANGFNVGEMKKSDKIAAAIVLRGLAKDGKFAAANDDGGKKESVKSVVESAVSEMSAWLEEMIKAADAATKGGTGGGDTSIGNAEDNKEGAQADAGSVNGIANGIKGIVDAAGKAEGEKGNALKDVEAASDGEANKDAGKLFKTQAGGGGADAADVAKAATAVSAVSGKQILKAIVEAAGGANQEGKKAEEATNPIAAAIGEAGDDANNGFNDAGMKKSDKIAAAIVLRGLAKGGKFAAANNDGGKAASVKSVVESAVSEMSAWLEEMIKAADAATKGGTGGGETSIGNAADGAQGATADAGSVKEIANGIKGIVDAAGKADGKDGNALKGVEAAAGDGNEDAGKLFKTQAGGGADAAAVAKAATAVSAVSGKQILKAIVEAAGGADQEGKKADEATNPIAAAIGKADDNANNGFNDDGMKKSDKIAAAIVLRGLAKDGKFAAADADGGKAASVKSVVESAVSEMSAWLEEMIKAADAAATKGGTGGETSIGNATDGAQGAAADAGSVKEIANGIKGIVDAAGKAEGEKGDALKGVEAAADDNKEAGKLFGTQAGGGVNAAAVAKAATAVSAVSGKQILKAIVEAAGGANQEGAQAAQAKNPIAAAIGAANDNGANGFNVAGMKKSDKIAAAIVLRGLAKDGKFAAANADGGKAASVKSVVESAVSEMSAWLEEMIKAAADAATKGGTGGGDTSIGNATDGAQGAQADAGSVKEIANGIKGIIDAAGKADGEKGDALKGVVAAADDNKDAGKLFGTQGAVADVAAVAKAATAVSAVSGKQILKAIVDAAGGGDQEGKKAAAATNPIAAAIGEADDNGAAFNDAGMKKSDKIAAAIVLRGLAKDGKFAAANADGGKKESVKSVVESAVSEMSAWLEEMIKAAADAATKGGTGGETSIGDATDNQQGAQADAESVKEIANGIKGIVDAAGKAAGKAEGKDGDALKGVEAAGDGNEDAGKLFKTQAGGGADAAAVAKAATAVSAVSGKQILKAIVEAAGGGDQVGKKAEEATNPIAAAIGAAGDNANNGFNDDGMKKSDKIAAAIVLRGLAKDGKFAAADAEGGKKESVKSVVESAVSEMSAWLEEMIKAADAATKGGTGDGDTSIGDATDNQQGAKADAGSVKEIANGIKGIVEAAGKADGDKGDALKDVVAASDDNADAGKLFKTSGGAVADVADVAKAATAVSAVSGKQILKAIVEAAGKADGDQVGKKAEAATNPIAAAIGEANDNGAAFNDAGMKKSDKIAAAIVLRGLAKDGKFAAAAAEGGKKESVKSVVESAVSEMSAWLEEMIKAADAATKGGTGGGTSIGNAADNQEGAAADAGSVKEIANGIKGIVDAAGKADGEDGDALKGVEAAADDNKDAGKLFKTSGGAGADVADVAKAATAVSAVSGKQILKAIVDAAGDGDQAGATAAQATNPIAAAIGEADDNGSAFNVGEMKKSDKIAAAIVLRGLAKGGKFAAANDDGGKAASVKSVVESAVSEMSAWLEEMIKAAADAATKGGTGDGTSIGNATDNEQGAAADAGSVNGIANGIKGIVEAAGKAEGDKGDALKGVEAASDDNADAGSCLRLVVVRMLRLLRRRLLLLVRLVGSRY
ncbi:variable large family protein [Borreliella bavariensis]|uniref:variable large family protein n=1 Tax=Borreliella bavariensis TaxID=664662 RepID=UPI003B96A56A